MREEAIIQAKVIAIDINKQEYLFLEYKDKKWIPLTTKIFRARTIKDELELRVDAEIQSEIFKSEKQNTPPKISLCFKLFSWKRKNYCFCR